MPKEGKKKISKKKAYIFGIGKKNTSKLFSVTKRVTQTEAGSGNCQNSVEHYGG